MTSTAVPTVARRVPAWGVVLAAPLPALVVWVLAHLVLDVPLVAGKPPTTIGAAAVVVTAIVVALAAWGVRTVLFRRHRTGWFVTCGVVLLVSLLGPLSATSPAATLWLALMHVTVAAVVVPSLAPARTES